MRDNEPTNVAAFRERGSLRRDGGMAEPIRVLVCDAQRLVAESLAGVLASGGEFLVHERFPDTGVGTVAAVEDLRPGVVVVDHWLSGMSAPAVIRAVAARSPSTKIVVLSWFHGPEHIREALAAGAAAFLPKSVGVDRVDEAIRRAHAGESPVFKEELESLVGTIESRAAHGEVMAERLASLTVRELEILRLLGAGLDARDIASRLYISLGTVRNHIQRLLTKTGTQSQVRLLAVARDHGVIP